MCQIVDSCTASSAFEIVHLVSVFTPYHQASCSACPASHQALPDPVHSKASSLSAERHVHACASLLLMPVLAGLY